MLKYITVVWMSLTFLVVLKNISVFLIVIPISHKIIQFILITEIQRHILNLPTLLITKLQPLFICIIRYMLSAIFNFIHRIQNVEHGFRAISRVEISPMGVSHTNLMWLQCLITLDFLLTLLIVKLRKF